MPASVQLGSCAIQSACTPNAGQKCSAFAHSGSHGTFVPCDLVTVCFKK
ncbi:unnamed protein product [Staurois parvus]|uniref:Uncharacterized protein n=1 Tax=Staurois parvus TaxID=386267 RepID=A0ABN9BCN1_9NEOB|nr:unnamed protein product [Staurois parvus]